MQNTTKPKIAIIHDQLTQYGGAEKTLEALLDIFPDAEIITGYSDPVNISQKILAAKIIPGISATNSWVKKMCRQLVFLMPIVFESFDLRKYDVLISEGTAWPKGVITSPNQLHITYVYTPPRFLYGYATEGQKRDKWYLKPFLRVIDHFLRIWDYTAAHRPDFVLVISEEIKKRVKKFYGRESTIIYPPVELVTNYSDAKSEDFFLCISRLAAYKNIDVLISAFNLINLKLKVVGTGKEMEKLKRLAKENVELLGFVSEETKNSLLTECKGFIFPTDYEDFGIVVVEALAHGKPVLCHRSGGPLEIVQAGKTGMFFDTVNPESLANSIMSFDTEINAGKFDPQRCILSANRFSAERFKAEFYNFVMDKWEAKRA